MSFIELSLSPTREHATNAFCLLQEKKFIFHPCAGKEFPCCHFSEQETEVKRQIFLINSISHQ